MSGQDYVAPIAAAVVVGVASALAAGKVQKVILESQVMADLEDRMHRAYNEGWNAANNHLGNVKQRYEELFGAKDENPEETEKRGRAFKA